MRPKSRIHCTFNKENLREDFTNFIKSYIVPKIRYFAIFETNLDLIFSNIIKENFLFDTVKIIACNKLVIDVENIEDQLEILHKFHTGLTNHRGKLATLNYFKEKYFWPNMIKNVTEYINDCEICKKSKYNRKSIPVF